MTAKKRSGLMSRAVGSACKNASSSRVDGMTQAKKIRNTSGQPAAAGPAKVRNSVSGPS